VPTTTTTSTTTSTSTTTTSTTSTTTSTTAPPCADTQRPFVTLVAPIGKDLPGLGALLVAEAFDNVGGSGIDTVEFYYQDNGGSPTVRIGSDSTVPYSVFWTFPTCAQARNDTFKMFARAIDNCGNVRDTPHETVHLRGRGCFQGDAATAPDLRLGTDLEVAGGQGQVVIDGTAASFPGPGHTEIAASGRKGAHRVEAVLVAGRGEGGRWRFVLPPGGRAGGLRVIAGQVELATGDAVVFRLKGRAGERLVFTFASDAER
jgi:hypothetical protein